MKKTGVLFLVWILLLTFAACGGNATVAEAQEEVVSIGEKFLTGNLNADKAVAQLDGPGAGKGRLDQKFRLWRLNHDLYRCDQKSAEAVL